MNSSSSLFSQILSLINRSDFNKRVKEMELHKHLKGFSCWDQFISMLFCQLAQAKSLREICGGLKCCLGKLNHLGVKKAPTKSNLSYANSKRDWQLYEKTFYDLLKFCQINGGFIKKKKFRFSNKLYSMDASIIDLCITMFDWAKFRRTKGAVKLHLLLDHEGYLPVFMNITDGKTHEVNIAKTIKLPNDSILAVDMGYIDYKQFYKWTTSGIWFVTRQKSNAVYKVIKRNKLPKRRNIISDEVIKLTGFYSSKDYPLELRRVVVYDKKQDREIVLITNNFKLGATTIASIYKDRWEVEIFFKTIKQNLRVKTFVGTSANAVKIQIWTALIAILLIKYIKHIAKLYWSMSNLITMLRWNLFTYRNLNEWINDPYKTPPNQVTLQPMLPNWDSISRLC